MRDRSGAYAEGARVGAPDAQQVADRFHLVKNASDALDELLRCRQRQIDITVEAERETTGAPPPLPPAAVHCALGRVRRGAPPPLPPASAAEERPLGRTRQQQHTRRAARVARWERVRELATAGVSLSRIAAEVGIDHKTARRLLATPEPPRNRVDCPRPGGLTSPTLQPFVAYLQDRWQQGCHNVSRLYRELVHQGYTGSRSLVAQAVRP